MSEEGYITLHPSNWLYNAGVVGFWGCLDREDYLNNPVENFDDKYKIQCDGTIAIKREVFDKIKIYENYFENGKVVNLKGKNPYYPNFIDVKGNQKDVFKAFVTTISNLENTINSECDSCRGGILINKDRLNNGIDDIQKENFFSKISELNMVHNKLLGPSEKFPNSYWNLDAGFKICHLCTFLLIHHHLAFTRLADGSEIFINAPSFKLMYELNKLVRELFGKTEASSSQKREILAMSVIEYSRRLQTTLGQWNSMNIEIVIKRRDLIDFYVLPYETAQLLEDRAIAAILSDIGEFSVLNCILDGSHDELLFFAHDLIRISIKEKNKADNSLVNDYLKREVNKYDLSLTAQKILRLYANIIDRRNKCQSQKIQTI
jgi:CRISPR-associated protein Cst1